MFSAEDWDRLVADHAPLNVLLVPSDEADRVVGYAAVDPEDGEMFLLFVDPAHAGRGIGRKLLSAAHDALRAASCTEGSYTPTSRTRARWPSTPATAPTDRLASRTSTGPQCASRAS